MTQQTDANDVLMGGNAPPSAKFETEGTTWEGNIVAPPKAHQVREYDPNNPGSGDPKFFPSGDPIMGVTVDIQTTDRDVAIEDDDGIRRVYVEGRYIKEAVRNAVRMAGGKGLEVGGHLKVTFTHREDPMDKRSRKFWDVSYTQPGNAALMDDNVPKPKTFADAEATARQLLSIASLSDAQIAQTTGLSVDAVAGLRNPPPF